MNNRKTNSYKMNKCLVIGGAGMLGRAIIDQLLSLGKEVRILDRNPVELEGVQSYQGDIQNIQDIRKACEGVDTVFQTAAKIWDPGVDTKEFYDVNLQGNRNVIEVCVDQGVKKLIYTSSLDVILDGSYFTPIIDGDESIPYPEKLPDDGYCATKMLAEKEILNANGREGLLTCALRPVGIYGPRDKYHLPTVVELARSPIRIKLGLKFRKFHHSYVENVAYAHILAAKKLKPGSPVPGKYYFIGDDTKPGNFFDFFNPILKALGFPKLNISLPLPIAYVLAWIMEKINPKSSFNRFSVNQTCVDHTFTFEKAKKELGYEPIVSPKEGIKQTIKYFKNNPEKLLPK